MTDASNGRAERDELARLGRALRANATRVNRRDLLRWSAIAAGAVATARFGIGSARAAAPASRVFSIFNPGLPNVGPKASKVTLRSHQKR